VINNYRPGKPTKRVNLTAIKEALRDGRIWTKLGIVGTDDGNHYSLSDGDLLIEVRLMPDGEEVTCRMAVAGGGAGLGFWYIPAKGTEVVVAIPDGEIEAEPAIVGVLSTGSLPDGIAEGTIVIAESQVLVHDGSGGAVALALKSDVNQLRNEVALHTHVTTAVTGGGGPVGVLSPPAGPFTPPAGTTVLKGK
jgi:hypothetical protein